MKRTFIFDTETTGLIDNSLQNETSQPHIIELYGAVVDGKGDVIDEIEFFAKPPVKLEPIITRITGLKEADLADKPPFIDNAEKLRHIIESCDSVVAHNLGYDFGMVNIEMQRLHMKVNWPITRICTVEETEWYKGFRLNLAGLYDCLFNETFEGAHRAKSDVVALIRCFNEMREKGDL